MSNNPVCGYLYVRCLKKFATGSRQSLGCNQNWELHSKSLLDRDIEWCANSCETCHFQSSPPKSVLQPYPWPKNPWILIRIDFLGPINRKNSCFHGFNKKTDRRFFLSIFNGGWDSFSAAKLSELFTLFRLPRALTSNGAKCFVGSEFSTF